MIIMDRSGTIEQDAENETDGALHADASPSEKAPMMAMEMSTAYEEEALKLPHCTHSFLFTEPVGSIPFLLGLIIAAMTHATLVLNLVNSFDDDGTHPLPIPYNVEKSMRIAQYLAVFVVLLLEKEIPTGLYLLRRISRPYLKSKIPEASYGRFVSSSILRITIGYMYLIDVIIFIILSEDAFVMYYSMLSFAFIEDLGDIAFKLCKMDVFGQRLQRATLTPFFDVEFKNPTENLVMKWRMEVFLKWVYFINLAVGLAVMIYVNIMQETGSRQCTSITVTFGDHPVWTDALVQWPDKSVEGVPGSIETMFLAFSYFDGVYVKADDRGSEGRPVYVEQNKYDHAPYDETGFETVRDPIVPAEIKYCGGRWIFTHKFIRKSASEETDDVDPCGWLLRSPKTETFNLLDVQGKWDLWVGDIIKTEVTTVCNECTDNYDCNLNGVCNKSSKKCECNYEDGVQHLGLHCEEKLISQCRTILGNTYNDKWNVSHFHGSDEIFQEYSRPVYQYISGLPKDLEPNESDGLALMYSGSRWLAVKLSQWKNEALSKLWIWHVINYHAFWTRAYKPGVTFLISDPTTKDTPAGVDFYSIGERDSYLGPYGALYPSQNETGLGLFRCEKVDEVQNDCSFCPNGIVDGNIIVLGYYTCLDAFNMAHILFNGADECTKIQLVEERCCQNDLALDINSTGDG